MCRSVRRLALAYRTRFTHKHIYDCMNRALSLSLLDGGRSVDYSTIVSQDYEYVSWVGWAHEKRSTDGMHSAHCCCCCCCCCILYYTILYLTRECVCVIESCVSLRLARLDSMDQSYCSLVDTNRIFQRVADTRSASGTILLLSLFWWIRWLEHLPHALSVLPSLISGG
jgi:hypothetical protein